MCNILYLILICAIYHAFSISAIHFPTAQATISWRASGNRQISLNASAERAFAYFRDKKTLYFTIANFRNKNVVYYTFLQQLRFVFLQFFFFVTKI